MFESSYTMDVKRFIRWYAPPVSQQKHFKLWILLLILSCVGTTLFYTFQMGEKYISLGWLMIFISCYRGLFFDILYARRQFYATCRHLGKGEEQQWSLRSVANECGLSSYLDESPAHTFCWDEVELFREDDRHMDFLSGEHTIRFEKDSFAIGSAEALRRWVCEHQPQLPYESKAPIYLPLT